MNCFYQKFFFMVWECECLKNKTIMQKSDYDRKNYRLYELETISSVLFCVGICCRIEFCFCVDYRCLHTFFLFLTAFQQTGILFLLILDANYWSLEVIPTDKTPVFTDFRCQLLVIGDYSSRPESYFYQF